MTDYQRQVICFALWVVGMGWFLGVKLYRGNSQDHSRRMFWLHLTAPMIAIVLMTVALVVMVGSDRFQKRQVAAEVGQP